MTEDENKALANITLTDIMGSKQESPEIVYTTNLPMALNVGKCEDFIKLATIVPGVVGAMWNETDVALIHRDHNTLVRYVPETHPYCQLFTEREEKRNRDIDDVRVWEGDFAPVQFSKQNLLKFLKLVEIVDAPQELVDSIKNMRVLEKNEQKESINLNEGDTTKTTIEETMKTNLPKKFSLMIPVSEDFIGKFQFEAKVTKKKDNYGHEDPIRKVIELRCTNAREVLRSRMQEVVKRLPSQIPTYYGKMAVRVGEREIW